MSLRTLAAAGLCGLLLTPPANAGDADDTFRWLGETNSLMIEGVFWNDMLGDGQDRYKTGGTTQALVLPQRVFTDGNWFADRAAAIELQARGLVVTPDNTADARAADRPYGQYAGIGVYLRLSGRPVPLGGQNAVMTEDRIGIELGLLGEPLPLFEIQEALHGLTSMGDLARTPGNTLKSRALANVEARRTWRFHTSLGGHDAQIAPFAHVSAGLRENALRLGGDVILGSSLEARTWNHDLAIGALIPGGSRPRGGAHWMLWAGGDAGAVFSDALIDGQGAAARPFQARLRAGVMLEWQDLAVGYSVAWLSPEFDGQPQGQLVGTVQLKVDF